MIRRALWRIAVALARAAGVGVTAAVRAQNATPGTLGGGVRDAQLGVLPDASVVAVHAPTGTRYEAFTRADGRFDLLNAQVGPYDMEIALSGFGTQALSGVVVTLGEATEVPVTLQLATVTETVHVTAGASSVFLAVAVRHDGQRRVGRHRDPADDRAQPPGLRPHEPVLRQDQPQRRLGELLERGRPERPLQQHPDRRCRQHNDLFGLAAQGTPGGQANNPADSRGSRPRPPRR